MHLVNNLGLPRLLHLLLRQELVIVLALLCQILINSSGHFYLKIFYVQKESLYSSSPHTFSTAFCLADSAFSSFLWICSIFSSLDSLKSLHLPGLDLLNLLSRNMYSSNFISKGIFRNVLRLLLTSHVLNLQENKLRIHLN